MTQIKISAVAEVGKNGVPIVEAEPKFKGTDVAVSELFRCLRDDRHNLATFLTLFPDVTLEQARDALKEDLRRRLRKVVICEPGYVSGTPRFVGTRIPVKTLFDHLDRDNLPDELFKDFPGIGRERANETLTLAREIIEWMAYEDFA